MNNLDDVMRALRAPVRREILSLIWDREVAAGQIARCFALTHATISEHLGVLRDAGLVKVTRVGTSRRYRARKSALSGLHGALEATSKWTPADGAAERELATTATHHVVIATVEVLTDIATTFGAFTDDRMYSRWLQAPVTIRDGRFAATLEWGTEVRGRYELIVPPHLIVMSWDFDDDNVPVPGRPLTGYLRLSAVATGGTHVEVHQLVDTAAQASFMRAAWSLVLGRLQTNIATVTASGTEPPPRPPRAKGDPMPS